MQLRMLESSPQAPTSTQAWQLRRLERALRTKSTPESPAAALDSRLAARDPVPVQLGHQ